ncbi:MAG: helix-turn-helix transcriptional regulator [Actinomycetota bacterium]|nr:helix-turn-helix transcriptional regulator [Actinomycetota bacterium]
MTDSSVALKDDGSGSALRHYTYYRPTILVLLKQYESHGYQLASRMSDLGFDHRLTASLYGVLRDMEDEGLIASSWDLSGSGGPPRRVYALTAPGEQYLRESIPTLVRQRQALDATLDLFSRLDQAETTIVPIAAAAQAIRNQPADSATPGPQPRPHRPRRTAVSSPTPSPEATSPPAPADPRRPRRPPRATRRLQSPRRD